MDCISKKEFNIINIMSNIIIKMDIIYTVIYLAVNNKFGYYNYWKARIDIKIKCYW